MTWKSPFLYEWAYPVLIQLDTHLDLPSTGKVNGVLSLGDWNQIGARTNGFVVNLLYWTGSKYHLIAVNAKTLALICGMMYKEPYARFNAKMLQNVAETT